MLPARFWVLNVPWQSGGMLCLSIDYASSIQPDSISMHAPYGHVGGRVVVVSAELHTLATGASPDYKYGSGEDAYNRRCVSAEVLSLIKSSTSC